MTKYKLHRIFAITNNSVARFLTTLPLRLRVSSVSVTVSFDRKYYSSSCSRSRVGILNPLIFSSKTSNRALYNTVQATHQATSFHEKFSSLYCKGSRFRLKTDKVPAVTSIHQCDFFVCTYCHIALSQDLPTRKQNRGYFN